MADTDNSEATKLNPEGSQFKKILMLTLPVLLVVFVAVGGYFSGIADSFFSVEEKAPEEQEALPKAGGGFFEVPELLVNLSVKPGQKPIYFKIKVVLELASQADIAQTEKMLPRIIDSLQFYLREMRFEELQGSMGTYRLKEELVGRMNKILAPVQVNDVLLKEILIQ